MHQFEFLTKYSRVNCVLLFFSSSFFSQLSVHGVNLSLVSLLALVSFQFESRGEDVVLNREGIGGEEKLVWFLDTRELVVFGDRVQAVLDYSSEGLVVAESAHVLSFAVCSCPLLGVDFINYDNCDTTVLERVTVDHNLRDIVGQNILVLKLFGSNVLTLRELEDVLDAVNDLKTTVGVEQADITRAEPAFIVKGFFGLLWNFIIARGAVRSHHLDLSTRVRLVVGGVVHGGYISEAELNTLKRASNVSRSRVFGSSDATSSSSLSKTVTFHERAAEANLEER